MTIGTVKFFNAAKGASPLSTRSSMGTHKYQVGQTLSFNPTSFEDGSKGSFEVTRQMPFEGVEFMYRIKSLTDNLERVAPESQLLPLAGHESANAFKPKARPDRR